MRQRGLPSNAPQDGVRGGGREGAGGGQGLQSKDLCYFPVKNEKTSAESGLRHR